MTSSDRESTHLPCWVFSCPGDASRLPWSSELPVRADRAIVETTESDTSVVQAPATIGYCSTGLRSVNTSPTVTNFRHAQHRAGSGSQVHDR
jgi:hypothetical protein